MIQIHQNPLFYKLKDKTLLEVVNKGCDIALHIGDSFGLLPDLYWFKIVDQTMDNARPKTPETPDLPEFLLENEENHSNGETQLLDVIAENVQESSETSNGVKRKLPSWLPDSNKRSKGSCDDDQSVVDDEAPSTTFGAIEPIEEDTNSRHSDQENESTGHISPNVLQSSRTPAELSELNPHESDKNIEAPLIDVKVEIQEIETNLAIVKQEVVDENVASISGASSNDNQNTSNVKVKEEKTDSQDVSSSTAPLRDSCPYGVQCYRQVFRLEFYH